jgi:hypothetical protein
MIKDIFYIAKNHPHLRSFFSSDEVFGTFDNGQTYSYAIGPFEEVLVQLQKQYDEDVK